MKTSSWLLDATDNLKKAGIGTARLDSLIFNGRCSEQRPSVDFAAPQSEKISKTQLKSLNNKLKQRAGMCAAVLCKRLQ